MFFNPAQNQSFFNSPQWMQTMQQMQGSGALGSPMQQQQPNMSPQIPMASPQEGGAAPQMQAAAPQNGQAGNQGGFFGQMMQSPSNMMMGLSGLNQLGGMAGKMPGLIGSFGSEAAGPMMSGAAGYSTGSGLLGALGGLGSYLGLA